jgi:hypothetical protein
LNAHDEGIKLEEENKKRAEQGIAPKRNFNLQSKLKELKKKDEEDQNKTVIDPNTVKIRGINQETTEEDLMALLEKFG